MTNKKSKKSKSGKAENNDTTNDTTSGTSGSVSIESGSSNSSFTPFTTLRKSFKRLKRKKDVQRSSMPEAEGKENIIKKKHGEEEEQENNNHNILKRITSGKRFRLKNRRNPRNVSSTNDIHKFDVIEWSSCESLSDNFEKRTRKHNSLRRSKASLLMPASGKTKASPPSTKITRYSSLSNILENKSNKPETTKFSSAQNVGAKVENPIYELSPKEQSTVVLRENSDEKRKRPKSRITSTSLPNICEERLIARSTKVEIEGNVYFHEESNNDTEKILKSLLSNSELKSDKKLDIFLGMNQKRCSLIILDERNKMFGSSPFLNRPPIPSDPKPILRRDQALRRWVSTEGLSPKKRRSESADLHHSRIHKRAMSDCNFMVHLAQERKLGKEVQNNLDNNTENGEVIQKKEFMVQSKEALNKPINRNLLCSSSVTNFGNEKVFEKCELFSSIQNIPSIYSQNEEIWLKTISNVSLFFTRMRIFSVLVIIISLSILKECAFNINF